MTARIALARLLGFKGRDPLLQGNDPVEDVNEQDGTESESFDSEQSSNIAALVEINRVLKGLLERSQLPANVVHVGSPESSVSGISEGTGVAGPAGLATPRTAGVQ